MQACVPPLKKRKAKNPQFLGPLLSLSSSPGLFPLVAIPLHPFAVGSFIAPRKRNLFHLGMGIRMSGRGSWPVTLAGVMVSKS